MLSHRIRKVNDGFFIHDQTFIYKYIILVKWSVSLSNRRYLSCEFACNASQLYPAYIFT